MDSPRRLCVQTRGWSSFTKFYPVRLLLYLLGDLASFALGEGTSKIRLLGWFSGVRLLRK